MGTTETKVKIFERGQVWHWEDPIFESKDKKLKIPEGESTHRYSRYVLIIQNTDTILVDEDDGTNDEESGDKKKKKNTDISVIPITTADHGFYSVPVTIKHGLKKTNMSYAFVQRQFPIDANQLANYQCRLSDEDMEAIENKMFELNYPSIVSRQKVVEKNLNSTKEDIKARAKLVSEEPTLNVKSVEEKADDNVYTEAIQSERDIIAEVIEEVMEENKTTKKTRRKLPKTIKYKQRFVENYKNDKEKCAKDYGYTPKSAYTMFLKYRREIAAEEEAKAAKTKTIKTEVKTEVKTETPKSPTTYKVPNLSEAVSSLSNRLNDEVRRVNFAKYLTSINNKVWSTDFYTELQNTIYFSLLELLGLRSVNGKVSSMAISTKNMHIATYTFLDIYYNDIKVRSNTSFEEIVKQIKIEGGYIEREFINILSNTINRKLGLSASDRKRICDYIGKFCA